MKGHHDNSNKALYVGAGSDLGIIQYMPHIQLFYFCDCQPFSEFGKKVYLDEMSGRNLFSRPNFINELMEEAIRHDILLKSVDKDVFTFVRGHQTIVYFINTSMPEDIYKIADSIQDFRHLIVSGHYPHSIVLQYATDNDIHFWGTCTTCFSRQDEEEEEGHEDINNIVYLLHHHDSLHKQICKYHLIVRCRPNIVIDDDNWESFVNSVNKIQYEYHMS